MLHRALLLAVGVGLFLVNLGGPSLWDLDEGRNATAALEMLESGNWVVPTFNGELRAHKPVLLYWLQALAYLPWGVNEFGARLPSAVAAMLTLLVTYELGRRLFDARVGLVGGCILASSVSFCAAAHFANPDALLTLFSSLSLFAFWQALSSGRRFWFAAYGASSGLAVLAKGPVGLLLPGAVMVLYLIWARQGSWSFLRRSGWAVLLFVLVALPWYVWVAIETKGQFLRDFLLTHNIERGLSPMENHRGPVFYYLLALVAGFTPWSVFLLFTAMASVRRPASAGREPPAGAAGAIPTNEPAGARHGVRFLCSWIIVYLAVFTVAATKLPNYILPLYPALALLTARALEEWRRGESAVPDWVMHVSLACLVLVGLGVSAGLLVAGGGVELPMARGRPLHGLAPWASIGLVPLAAALAAWSCWRARSRSGLLLVLCAGAILFLGPLAVWGGSVFNRWKAPRPLVEQADALRREADVRVGCLQLDHLPSLHFYVQRDVRHHHGEREALTFLQSPLPVYLFLPEPTWRRLQGQAPPSCRIAGRHPDFYRQRDIVVVVNH
jgi:4-amino-4-deoxy-L-arabinose transferase-like glycosyltransferase